MHAGELYSTVYSFHNYGGTTKSFAALPAIACVFAMLTAGSLSETTGPASSTAVPSTAIEAGEDAQPGNASPTSTDVPSESFLTQEN